MLERAGVDPIELERELLGLVANDLSLLDVLRDVARVQGLRAEHLGSKLHRQAFAGLKKWGSERPLPFEKMRHADELNSYVAEVAAKYPSFESTDEARRHIERLVGKIIAAHKAKPAPVARASERPAQARPAADRPRDRKRDGAAVPGKRRGRPKAVVPREILWLNQVVSDRALPPLCFHLAYCIAQLWNVETDDAWPSQETLATKLAVDPRTIRNVVEPLVERGHLEVIKMRGRGHTNRYRPVLKTGTAVPLFQHRKQERRRP